MITEKDVCKNKSVLTESYKSSLIETINFLENFKKKKLQKVEVKNYLEEMKSNIRLNFNNFNGSYADLMKIQNKKDFLKQYKGKNLAELRKSGIRTESPAFEFNFKDGIPRIGAPHSFVEGEIQPKDYYNNVILIFFFGRPKFFTEGLILSDFSNINSKSSLSDKSLYKVHVEKENDKDFFESFYKNLENYRKRTINDKIDLLKSDFVELINIPLNSFEDSRINRLQKIRNYFGLGLFKDEKKEG